MKSLLILGLGGNIRGIRMPRNSLMIIILLLLAAFAGCAPKIGASGKAAAVPIPVSTTGTEQLAIKQGKLLAATSCITCHRFYFPKEYSPKQWDVILEWKRNRLSLTQSQVDCLGAYLKKRDR